ncbi:MAG: CBS domain-containing protein [Nitrosomonadaceae bacterium]
MQTTHPGQFPVNQENTGNIFSALPVMVDDRVVGIISERDYIRKAAPKRLLPWEIKVEDIMTINVISTTRTEAIHNCMKTMSEHRIKHLPVIEKEQLIGMISITDVVLALRL